MMGLLTSLPSPLILTQYHYQYHYYQSLPLPPTHQLISIINGTITHITMTTTNNPSLFTTVTTITSVVTIVITPVSIAMTTFSYHRHSELRATDCTLITIPTSALVVGLANHTSYTDHMSQSTYLCGVLDIELIPVFKRVSINYLWPPMGLTKINEHFFPQTPSKQFERWKLLYMFVG